MSPRRTPDDPGVLILSRFAGAARECGAALLVNPYDPEGVAIAINRALSMPLEERPPRHAQNFRVLAANDLATGPNASSMRWSPVPLAHQRRKPGAWRAGG